MCESHFVFLSKLAARKKDCHVVDPFCESLQLSCLCQCFFDPNDISKNNDSLGPLPTCLSHTEMNEAQRLSYLLELMDWWSLAHWITF